MGIKDHIELQQNRIAAINSAIATASSLGDIERLAQLEAILAEAEDTLARLKAA